MERITVGIDVSRDQLDVAVIEVERYSWSTAMRWAFSSCVGDCRPSAPRSSHQLIRAGKSGKVAVTAIMTKLIVMANALLRDGRKWSELRP
jgi:hypothetical protein